MNIFNEKDRVVLRLSNFKRETGEVLLPGDLTALWYRVDEQATKTNQVAQTSVTPADPVYLAIAPAANVMVNSDLDREIVEITYHFEYGANTGKTKTVMFQRKNLSFLS